MALLDFSGADTPLDPSWLQTMLPSAQGAPAPLSPAAPAGDPSFMDRMLNAIRHVESRGDPNAVSPAGAVGPYQIMPKTAADPGYGVSPLSPDQLNQEGPARKFAGDYLKALYSKLGSWPAAFAAYNGGMKQGLNFNSGAPMPAETTNYVPAVQDAMAQQGAGSQPAPMTVGTDQSTPYDAATDGPGGATPPAAPDNGPPSLAGQPQPSYPDGMPPEAMPNGMALGPGATVTSDQGGAPFQAPSAPAPAAAPAPAPQQARLPSMEEYMRGMSGGDTTMGRIGDALMAIGAGLPGNGMRGASQALLEMSQRRKERMLEAQQKMYPQKMAYDALVSQGMDPNQAMIRVFAPQAAGQWEPKDIQTGLGVTKTILWNSALGKGYDPATKQYIDMGVPGSEPGAAGVPASGQGKSMFGSSLTDANGAPLGGEALKNALQSDPSYANLAPTAIAIAEGKAAPKDLASMKGDAREIAFGLASRIAGKPIDLNLYNEAVKTRASFAPGGAAFKDRQAVDQMLTHLEDYNASSEAWGKLQADSGGLLSGAKNAAISAIEGPHGRQNPILDKLMTDGGAASDEVAKSWKGSGQATDAESAKWDAVLRNPNSSVQERRAVIKEIALKLVPGRMLNYQDQIDTMPMLSDLNTQMLTPHGKRSMQNLQNSLIEKGETLPSQELLTRAGAPEAAPDQTAAAAPKIQINPGEQVWQGNKNDPNDKVVVRDGKYVHVMTGEPMQ